MKKIFIFLLLFISAFTYADVYYCSPTGDDDTGDGSIGDPWATWEKLGSVLTAGDTGYVRGGTYTNYREETYQCRWNGLTGTSSDTIKIWAYPTEIPVWDFVAEAILYPAFILQMYNCDYVWVRGLTIKNCAQPTDLSPIIAFNLTNSSHNVIENCTVDNIGGFGFLIGMEMDGAGDMNTEYSNHNLFLNCDASRIEDPLTSYTGANGFSIMHNGSATNSWAQNTIFKGCRAWWCSDDGFDFYGANGHVTIENCWSFWNGYIKNTFNSAGEGNAFKLGPVDNAVEDETYLDSTLHTVVNCLAVNNKYIGFDANAGKFIHVLYNNLSYGNGGHSYFFAYDVGIENVLKNNIEHENTYNHELVNGTVQEYNDWNLAVTVTDADFVSLDSSQLDNARQANGNLPVITFGHLAVGSDLINAGISVGWNLDGDGYVRDENPDLGPFEYGAGPPDIPPDLPTVITSTPSVIYTRLARGGGNVTDNGGGAVYDRGIVWSTSINPTILDNKLQIGTSEGIFSGNIPNLKAGTTYYIQAYASNATGTAYGGNVTITTPDYSIVKTGGHTVKTGTKTVIHK